MFWTVSLEGAPKRVNHAAAVVGNFIYSFGGYTAGIDFEEPSPISVFKLNTVTYRWKEIIVDKCKQKHSPFQRYGHTAVVYGTNIIVWGGQNDRIPCNKVFLFDTVRNEWSCPRVTGDIPNARDGHTSCVIGDNMYIMGGVEGGTNMMTNDVYSLNLKTMEWEYFPTTGEPPPIRDFHTAAAVGSRMYIYGGRNVRPYCDEIYWPEISYLDVETRVWEQPPTTGQLPYGRRSCSSFVLNDNIYMFGGCKGHLHFNDFHEFNTRTNAWRKIHAVGTPPSTRRRHCCVLVNNCAFIFGGSRPGYPRDGLHSASCLELVDLGDLHVLHLGCPSLRTMCLMKVIKEKLDCSCLPRQIQNDIKYMVTPGGFS